MFGRDKREAKTKKKAHPQQQGQSQVTPMQALQVLIAAAQQAPLNWQAHVQCQQAASFLAQYLQSEQTMKAEKKEPKKKAVEAEGPVRNDSDEEDEVL